MYADYLDTPHQVINASKQLRWRWDNIDPFGANFPNQNPAALGGFGYNLRFAGQFYDAESGQHYNMFRDYSPGLGRYLESDPVGLSGGLNTYSYVGGNPLRFVDPLGLVPCLGCHGNGSGGIMDWYNPDPYKAEPAALPVPDTTHDWVDNPDAKREHDEYEERYKEPPPPNLDECEFLKWKLKKEEDLLRDRQAWDAKWLPGRHANAIEQSQNAIRNLKEKIKKAKCSCP